MWNQRHPKASKKRRQKHRTYQTHDSVHILGIQPELYMFYKNAAFGKTSDKIVSKNSKHCGETQHFTLF